MPINLIEASTIKKQLIRVSPAKRLDFRFGRRRSGQRPHRPGHAVGVRWVRRGHIAPIPRLGRCQYFCSWALGLDYPPHFP